MRPGSGTRPNDRCIEGERSTSLGPDGPGALGARGAHHGRVRGPYRVPHRLGLGLRGPDLQRPDRVRGRSRASRAPSGWSASAPPGRSWAWAWPPGWAARSTGPWSSTTRTWCRCPRPPTASTCSSTRPATWRSCCCFAGACRASGRASGWTARSRPPPWRRAPAAVAFEPIVEATVGDPVTVAVNLAYPLGDLLLLSLVVASFALSGWRPDRGWMLMGARPGADGGRRRRLPLPGRQGHLRGGHDARRPLAGRRAARGRRRLAAGAAPAPRPGSRAGGWSRSRRWPAWPPWALETYDHFDRIADGALVLATAHASCS